MNPRHLFIAPLMASLAMTMAGCAGKQLRNGPAPVGPASSEGDARATSTRETAPESSRSPVCYDCFWEYQPAGFREELAKWYHDHPQPDPLADADRRYLLARVDKDAEGLCEARGAFEALRGSVTDPDRRLLVEETVASPPVSADQASSVFQPASINTTPSGVPSR